MGITEGIRTVLCTHLSVGKTFTVCLPLLGLYQLANLKTVLSTINRLSALLPVSDKVIDNGCRSVVVNTGLKGRFQPVQQQPTVIADTAHNQPGIEALLATIQTISYARLRLVVGFMGDKDVLTLLRLLPVEAVYYFCQANITRALPVGQLVDRANSIGLVGQGYVDVDRAIAAALAEANRDDLIVITGSTYVVAEINSL